MAEKQEFTMTAEEQSTLEAACSPYQPMRPNGDERALGDLPVGTREAQRRANLWWAAIGTAKGFKWKTVEVGDSFLNFLAEPA